MALLADEELDALRVQMDHTAAVAAQPTYPLTPTTPPKEPVWRDSPSGGYYDDQLGHYSNNGGASWDYTPPASSYPLAPNTAPSAPVTAPVDPYGSAAPYVTPDTAPADYGGTPSWPTPTQQDFVAADRGMDTTNQFRPDWGVMTTPAEQGGGGFFGGLKSAAGAVGGGIKDFAGDYVDVLQKNRPSGSVMGLGSIPGNTREATPGEFAEGAQLMTSGNAIANKLGLHPENLPYGLGYVTDAINPATLATIAAGPTVPLLGSTFSGGLASRAAGEIAVNAAGNAGGAIAARKAAEYTDNPWIVGGAGLLGGLAGAGGVLGAVGAAKRAPGALKAADRALTGIDAKIMEPAGAGMGRPVTAGVSAFHGTDAPPFERFDPARIGSSTDEGLMGAGHYFSTDPNVTRTNTTRIAAEVGVENPLKVEYPNWNANKNQLVNEAIGTEGLRGQPLTDAIVARGYDGVVLDYSPVGYKQQEIVAFDTNKIRVTGSEPVTPSRLPGELRAGPTMDDAAKATTVGRAAANPATLTDQELIDSIKRADDMVRQADTRAADLVRSQGPKDADTIAANRTLTTLENDAERLRDEAVRRGGITTLASKLNDETGALDMGAVGERFGEAGKRAARIFADAAEKEGRPTSGGIFDMLAPTERAGTGLVRRYEGAVGTAGLDLRRDLDVGNRLLKDAKQPGTWDGTRFVAKRTPEMEQLFKALHGEGQPPASLQKVYDAIKPMVEKESAATIDFDKAFVPRDDYFYRGWKEVPVGKAQNAGTGKGQFGAKPGFMKPRSDQSFSDILKTVYTKPDGSQVRLEPVSWNPFEMAAIRKTAGEQFRAQSDLLAGLKETGMAVSADVAPDGWRVPRVGPAFEGKPFAFTPAAKDTGPMARLADEGGAAVGYTKRIAVPDKIANDIESIFGRQPSFGALDSVLSFGQKAKQSKLLLSLFQQMDFGARTLGALNAGVIDELAETVTKAVKLQPGASASHLVAAGRKFMAIPKDLAELPLANVSGAAQRRLRAGILDAKPIYKERPGITLKGVSEAGGKFGTDISLVTRDIMADIAKEPKPAYLTTGVVGRRIRQVNAASQRGLFDGWYVQAQSTALKKTILPRIMRQHPGWTDAQIMAGGADEVNKMFSTLGEYQTAIKNPAVKKLARGLIFSTNETEALLRGAASTVIGPNKRLWTEFYLGTFLGLATIAETVHYATTGEHLPMERLNPIDTENKYGPLPVGYRTNFLAPDIPIKGRNNTNLTLDTVMQMDTIFRLLDPKAFVASRENVLPRAATNQVTGKDFYGRPLKGPKDRITQAAIDLAEPIGLGNLRAATGIGPDSESRIGTAGALLQTAGANVRAENNAALKDRLALEWAKSTGATKNDGSPITGWRDLDPLQRPQALESNPDIQRELEQRGEDAAKQGSEYGILAAKRKADAEAIRADNVRIQQEIDAKYIRPGTTIPLPGKGEAWRGEYNDHMYAIARQYVAKETIDPFTGKPYGSDMDKAVEAYYAAFDAARNGTKADYDQMDKWRVDHPAEAALVDKYLAGKNNTDMTEVVTAKKAAAKAVEDSGFFALKDDAWAKIQASKIPGTAGYEDYYAWRDAMQTKVASQLEAAGESKEYAMEEAVRLVAKTDPAKIQSDILKVTTSKWVVSHPAEAVTAWRWGYFNPGKENGQEAFLNDWIKKHPEFK